MPSQQSSFIGTRTIFTCQALIARSDATSVGPSKKPQLLMQLYSLPERLTPCSRTSWPAAFTSLFPCTWIGEGAPTGIGAGVTTAVGVGAGVAAGGTTV